MSNVDTGIDICLSIHRWVYIFNIVQGLQDYK